MRAAGYRVIDALVERYATLADWHTGVKADPAVLRPKLRESLREEPAAFDAVWQELQREILAHNGVIDHPRFFAFVPGPGNYVSALGDAVASGYNIFAGTWLEGSGATAAELAVVDWLRVEVGFPETAGGLFVSGGSVANITALVAARETRLGGDFGRARIYCSAQTHSSVERGLRIIGFRADQIVRVPAVDGRMQVSELSRAVTNDRAAGWTPFCVVANAGTTNTGAVDPLPELARLARREQLWLHADGAYGAAAVICERGKRELRGLELVDSLSLDPHKWLFQPFECGCVLLRDASLLRKTFAVYPDYLADVHRHDTEVNLCDYGVQLTRGARALKVWLSLRVFGKAQFRAAVERGFVLAEQAEQLIAATPGLSVVSPAQMAVVCFRADGSDELQTRIVDAMLAEGFAFLTSTKWNGATVLRLCTINPRTTEEDLQRTIARVADWARRLQ